MRFNETHTRSIIKAVTYRILMTGATMGIAYGVTEEITIALIIGGLEMMAKTVLYIIHERLWNKIDIGKE